MEFFEDMKTHQYFINGQYVDPQGEEWMDSLDPYTGKPSAWVPKGCAMDADAAIAAANRAMKSGPWSTMTATQRGKLMLRLAELATQNADRLAEIEVRDNGKLLADKIEGDVAPIDKPDMPAFTRPESVEVVVALSWDWAANRSTSCLMIAISTKPPRASPRPRDKLASPDPAFLSRTRFVRNSPSAWQRSTHQPAKVTPCPQSNIGPVIAQQQYRKIFDCIAITKAEGARCILGGGPATEMPGGQFVEPTIFVDVNPDMRIAREEVFDPVLSIMGFNDEQDAIRMGNDTIYGLAAGVWTQDIGRAMRVSKALKAGTVWVNTYRAISFMMPFGGMKHSGIVRESGLESIHQFLETKSTWISYAKGAAPNPFIMQ